MAVNFAKLPRIVEGAGDNAVDPAQRCVALMRRD